MMPRTLDKLPLITQHASARHTCVVILQVYLSPQGCAPEQLMADVRMAEIKWPLMVAIFQEGCCSGIKSGTQTHDSTLFSPTVTYIYSLLVIFV